MKLPNVNDASLYIGTRVLDQTDGGVLAVARVILEGDEHGPAIRATLVRGAEEPVDTFRQRITDMLRELKSYRTFDHRSVVYLASSNLHTAAEHMAADARWNAPTRARPSSRTAPAGRCRKPRCWCRWCCATAA